MCAAGLADDADPDRATVVVHAQLDGGGGAGIEGLTAIDVETARRLMADGRRSTTFC